MNFRKATPDDIPLMRDLRIQQLIDEGSSPDGDIGPAIDAFFHRMMAEDRMVEFLAEEGGQVVATGALCVYDLPPSFSNPGGQLGYVANMYTHPDFRRRGLASAILSRLEEEARLRGLSQLLLASSKWGRPVYERYGFCQDDRWYSLGPID